LQLPQLDLYAVFYNVQPADNTRGDFEDNSGAGYANAESLAADH
jgi:hypothetical protein